MTWRGKHQKLSKWDELDVITQPWYSSWNSMMTRCLNKDFRDYPLYGGRGITVCERWKFSWNFFEDMGDRPDGMQLERINNDLGYFPENCRWATIQEQSQNRRTNKLSSETVIQIQIDNRLQTEIAKRFNVNQSTVSRIKNNKLWSNVTCQQPH